jgi:hypothetical protein
MADVKTGRKWVKQSMTAAEYRTKRETDVKNLLAALEEWKEDWTEAQLAEFLAKWDQYHGNNPHLIEMGSGGLATDVDARGAWIERGYAPIGKNTGIKIVAPEVRKVDDPDNPGKKKEIVTGWHIVYVFDVRHVIDPDLRKQWNEDHPQDDNGDRHWGDEEEIRMWHAKYDQRY